LPRVRGRAGVGAAGRRSRGQAAPRRSVPPSQPSPAGGGRSRPAALDAALLPPPQAGEGAAVVALDSGLRSRLQTVGPARRSPMSSMRIGQLARTAGVAIDTVRYYERVGLRSEERRVGKEGSTRRPLWLTKSLACLRYVSHFVRILLYKQKTAYEIFT